MRAGCFLFTHDYAVSFENITPSVFFQYIISCKLKCEKASDCSEAHLMNPNKIVTHNRER